MQTSDSSSTAADRRQNPRTKLAEIAYIGMGPENGGLVLDVSEGGLSFHSVAPIQRDEKVQFLLSLRGHSRIEGTGEVVWTNNIGTVCGLRFTSLSPGALEHLNNWKAQANTSAPPRAKAIAQTPSIAAPPVVGPPTVVAKSSILKLESAEPIFAIAPAPDRDHAVHITEVRGQSPIFWIAVGALTTAFASVAFFYGMRVGRAYYVAPQTAEVSGTNTIPAPALPTAPAQHTSQPPASPATLSTASHPAGPDPSHTLVNTSKTEAVSAAGSAFPASTSSAPVHALSAGAPSAPTAPNAGTQTAIPTPAPVEAAKPAPVAETHPRLSPDDGKSEYSAAIAALNGDSGKRDTATAIELLQSASKKGDTLAEVTLADLYIYGDGVAQDCAQGKSLLAEASKRGNMQAKLKLEEITADGCPQ
ncbi:MAG TPA: PilZ domain-containing protein [Candidatus Acidoferrales bacterium]|nr:PilZ domain-containing protein [Candidatus Acidoferrales bacterium]